MNTYKIQMRQDNRWWDLGGIYSAELADERIMQFLDACKHKMGNSREFRRIAVGEYAYGAR